MPPLRSFAPAVLLLSLSACASLRPRSATRATNEITLDLSTSPARTREQLVDAFNAHGLPVATSQPGVVEFHAPREKGILGYYEVFARAVIVPLDCGTRVTLFGEETRYPNASAIEGTATRIGPHSSGRARDVWSKLESVAATMRGGSPTTSETDCD